MSSSDYFDDDIDEGFLEALEAAESKDPRPLANPSGHAQVPKPSISINVAPTARAPLPPLQKTANLQSDDYDLTFDFDESALQQLDAIENAHIGKTAPSTTVAPRPLARTSSKGGVQMTLFGEVLATSTNANSRGEGSSRAAIQRAKSSGQLFRKTKVWDHTVFSKTGRRRSKGKGKTRDDENEAGEEEQFEFEQFPAPFVSGESVGLS